MAAALGVAVVAMPDFAEATQRDTAVKKCKKNKNCTNHGTDNAGITTLVTCDPKGTPGGKCSTTTCSPNGKCVQTFKQPVAGVVGPRAVPSAGILGGGPTLAPQGAAPTGAPAGGAAPVQQIR